MQISRLHALFHALHTPLLFAMQPIFGNANQKFHSDVSKGRCKERASHMALLAVQDKNTLCNIIKYGGIDFGERCF